MRRARAAAFARARPRTHSCVDWRPLPKSPGLAGMLVLVGRPRRRERRAADKTNGGVASRGNVGANAVALELEAGGVSVMAPPRAAAGHESDGFLPKPEVI